MRVTVLCIVLSFAALVQGQRPQPCVSPAAWTADFFQRIPTEGVRDIGKFFYDAGEQRTATYVRAESPGEKDEFLDLRLYKEGIRYFADRNAGECRKTELDGPFRTVHIPVNATLNGQFYLGTSSISGGGILVESWSGNVTEGAYEILVTHLGCIPVNEVFYDTETGDLVETFFFDTVLGITDPNAFTPPPGCQ